jgi:diaminopimelate decarboxylase
MFYAMKANSARPLLDVLAPIVDGFEVASAGELAKARAVGAQVPVLFGGPVKTESAIAQALAGRVERLHVESVLELHRVSEVATGAGRVADVLLRVNLGGPFPPATLAMAGAPTQFGIDEPALGEAVHTALALPGVRLAGFHLHSLSNNLSADAHLAMLDLYRRKVTGWEAAFGLRCEVVNVGGGIGVDYADPAARFDWPSFAAELGRLAERTFPSHWREIDFECGRFLVAACGSYAAELVDIRRNHGVNYLLVRGGTHHFRLPASWQHSHPFSVLGVEEWRSRGPRPELRDAPVTVVGELCTPKDVLARDVVVSRARPGDVLVFHHAGAYGWEISHHDFLSHPHPEHVFLGDEDRPLLTTSVPAGSEPGHAVQRPRGIAETTGHEDHPRRCGRDRADRDQRRPRPGLL